MPFVCLAGKDPAECMNDPYVFPNEMGDDLAKKVPPVMIMTAEFCFLRSAAEEARDLYKRNGKLLDFCLIPEGDHMVGLAPKRGKQWKADTIRSIIKFLGVRKEEYNYQKKERTFIMIKP